MNCMGVATCTRSSFIPIYCVAAATAVVVVHVVAVVDITVVRGVDTPSIVRIMIAEMLGRLACSLCAAADCVVSCRSAAEL